MSLFHRIFCCCWQASQVNPAQDEDEKSKNPNETSQVISTASASLGVDFDDPMTAKWNEAKSVYEFSAKDLDGNTVPIENFRGRVLLIVNVASQCGLAKKNFKELRQVHEAHMDSGFTILAFPSNQFANQEPGSGIDIKEFARKQKLQFEMFAKIMVNGDEAHPLWKYLKMRQGSFVGDFIKWNFTKFLIDKNGQPIKRYAPTVPPTEIEKDIVALL